VCATFSYSYPERGKGLQHSFYPLFSLSVLPVQINNSGNKTQDGDDEKIIFSVHTRIYIIKMREYERWWLRRKFIEPHVLHKKQRKELLLLLKQ